MIKKWFLVFFTLALVIILKVPSASAADGVKYDMKVEISPIACQGNVCPDIMRGVYTQNNTYNNINPPEQCAADYPDFLTSPTTKHFWAEDPAITAQGKADERARQFIYWVLNKNAVDNHPVLKSIWNTTSSMAFIFMVVVAAIMGLGFIVAQRANFELNIKVWPFVTKIALALLYIFFSWIIVLSLIQISEWIMKLFTDNLGGKDLFNVYFDSASGSSEKNYTTFIGCRDLNMRVQEAADAQMFLFKITNFTYYAMGVILILRKILLWFLLFVSPFLALLMPFVFVRNIGWIWIGVFFQWLFYGPLFALFLGALNKMWQVGIPFAFDFSRAGDIRGYIYPTAMILTYGGPAQRGVHAIGALNSGNYVDTFAEYVITLIMLWAVIFFPWWLLRIFRDYCCDGIYAMKNILLSMYDQMRGGPGPSPTPPPAGPRFTGGLNEKMPKEVNVPLKVNLETVQEIKRTKTEDITRSLNLSATKLTDIARFETDKTTRQTVTKNLNYLSNPTQAETPTERQKYMNIRTELFNRAIKEDPVARQVLSATSNSSVEKIQKRQELIKSTPEMIPITNVISVKVQLPNEKVQSASGAFVSSMSNNTEVVNTISQDTNVPPMIVKSVLSSYKGQTQNLTMQTIDTVAKETGIDKQKVTQVVQRISKVVRSNKDLVKQVAQQENITEDQLKNIVDTQIPVVTGPNVEQTISIPQSVSIEDYEEVKKMWTNQYEKGEIPVSENIQDRKEWIDQDIIFISNTLNKILSTDDKLKGEGYDELGYILPIFIINNLKGEEVLVYLKAKLEAAKAVKESMNKEQEITEKVKAEVEGNQDLVDVPLAKTESSTQEMHMSQEMDEKGPQTPSTEVPTDTTSTPPSDGLESDKT